MLESSIDKWDEVNIHELATLAYAGLAVIRRGELTFESVKNWLNRLEFESPPVVIQVRSARELVGWLLLFFHDGKRGEINPWALNGHPFVPSRKNQKQVTFKLIQQAIAFAKKHGLTRIDLSFRREIDEPAHVNEKYKIWYESLGLKLMTETAIMRYVLSEFNFEDAHIPSNFEIKSLTETDEDELYKCYYLIFNTGQDRFFFDQTDSEKRAFFNQTFNRMQPLSEETSLALTKNRQIIGFSLVRPTHGEGNSHLWMFGIHPDYRRKGLGKSFLQLIMKKAAQYGSRTMSLACELNNIPAYKLYRGQGFKEEFSKIEYSWKAGRE